MKLFFKNKNDIYTSLNNYQSVRKSADFENFENIPDLLFEGIEKENSNKYRISYNKKRFLI